MSLLLFVYMSVYCMCSILFKMFLNIIYIYEVVILNIHEKCVFPMTTLYINMNTLCQ